MPRSTTSSAWRAPRQRATFFSAGVYSDGSYGMDEGLMFSFPIRSDGQGGREIVQGLELSDFARAKIKATEDELKEERAVIADLLG